MESEYERLRKKVENFPSASAYNRLAELARLNRNDAEADQICLRCIKEFPRNGQAYVILAEIAHQHGKKEEAIGLLHNAVERDQRSYPGHKMLADLYLGDQQYAKALNHLRKILAFKANDPAVTALIEEISGKAGSQSAPAGPPGRKPSTNTFGKTAPTPLANAAITPGGVPVLSAKAAASPSSRTSSLQALCAETGVRGAVVSDAQGRVVITHGDLGDKAELLGALAADTTNHAASALKQLGNDTLTSWLVEAEKGQVLAFKRDQVLTLSVLADPGVRAALLELRARQVLIDLGAV